MVVIKIIFYTYT